MGAICGGRPLPKISDLLMSHLEGTPSEKLKWLQEKKAAGKLDGDDPEEIVEAEALLRMLTRVSDSRAQKHLDELLDDALGGTFPASDPNIPMCRLKIFTPGPTKPDNPDPILRPLDQFTLPGAKPPPKREKLPEPYEVEAPNTPSLTAGGDDGPTVDEIASHEEDEIDAELGLSEVVAAQPRNFTLRDNHARGSRRDRAGQEDHLPDVAAGGSQNRARRHAEA